jgi:hypothetical protein
MPSRLHVIALRISKMPDPFNAKSINASIMSMAVRSTLLAALFAISEIGEIVSITILDLVVCLVVDSEIVDNESADNRNLLEILDTVSEMVPRVSLEVLWKIRMRIAESVIEDMESAAVLKICESPVKEETAASERVLIVSVAVLERARTPLTAESEIAPITSEAVLETPF